MSLGIDVNILLYASDGSSLLQQRATAFLEHRGNGRKVCCLTWLTIMSYLRMATHPRRHDGPSTYTSRICQKVISLVKAGYADMLPRLALMVREFGRRAPDEW